VNYFTRCINNISSCFYNHDSHINVCIEFGLLLALFTIIIFSVSKFTFNIINDKTIPMKKEGTSSSMNDVATTTTNNNNNTDDNFNKDNHNENHNDDIESMNGISQASNSKRRSKSRSNREKTPIVHDDTLEQIQHMSINAYTNFKVILSPSSSYHHTFIITILSLLS